HCQVTAGGMVSDHKGVALPRLPLPGSALTAKDRDDLRFGIEHGVDYVAVSFVRTAADIQEVRKFLREQGADLPIVAKLERAETATGRFPVETVEMMARIAERAERAMPAAGLKLPRPEAYGFSEAVAEAACQAARLLHAKAIVAFTQSGFTARLISQDRPDVP